MNGCSKEKSNMSEEEIRERILRMLSSAEGPFTTSEIARSLGLNRRATLRILQRLAIEGRIKGRRARVAKGLWFWWV